MSDNNGYAPSFRLCRFYERRSKNGATYYVGRLGGARIVLLKSRDESDNGEAILDLMVSEAPPPRQQDHGNRKPPATKPEASTRSNYYDHQAPLDAEIPF
jgi:hypothetical protein